MMEEKLRREMLKLQNSMKVSSNLLINSLLIISSTQLSHNEMKILNKSDFIEGTGPLTGSLGIRSRTQAEQRQLRDSYLRNSC